jgi:hypothetical protein
VREDHRRPNALVAEDCLHSPEAHIPPNIAGWRWVSSGCAGIRPGKGL